ncbi:MAG TPA: acyltransferase [Acidobacteriaceae bacterium]|nr:acyltransferase [Acidobacteriaceae bacterium]
MIRTAPAAVAVANPPTPMEHHRFHFLDALRGIAAVLVVFRHAPQIFQRGLYTRNSYLAVDFFFCLSGFVVAFSYEGRLASSMKFRDFAVARIIRLMPIAILGAAIGAIELGRDRYLVGHLFIGRLAGLFLMNSVMLPHLPKEMFPLDEVMWSLWVELIANFAYAALVRVRLAGTGLLFGISFLSFVGLAYERKVHGTFDLGYAPANAHVGLLRVGVSFFIGVLVLRLYRRWAPSRLHNRRAILAMLFVVGVLVFSLCNNAWFSGLAAVEMLTVVVVYPAIIYLGARAIPPSAFVAPCVVLGTVSYVVYILHPPLLWFLGRHAVLQLGAAHPGLTRPTMLIYTAFIVALCWAVAHFYESPIHQWLSQTYRTRAVRRLA